MIQIEYLVRERQIRERENILETTAATHTLLIPPQYNKRAKYKRRSHSHCAHFNKTKKKKIQKNYKKYAIICS